ncbi:MAG: hypothetical protein JSV08_06745 [Acidobacteriota bacterium]|nr:MAG: hypothetical protein JSV08_06745 [Acidobacteriota bacterium]
MSGKKRFLWIAALAFCAVLALSCGGGGGSGGTGGGLVISWSPGSGLPAAGNVELVRDAASTPSLLVLDVVVYGPLSDVYGIAFHLSYDESVFVFAGASKTTILDDVSCSGACIQFPTPDETNPDLLIVSMSRTGNVGGVALPDQPNVFMTLQFTPVAAGSSGLSFVPGTAKVCDPALPDCVDLSGTWTGGIVLVS